MSVKTETIKVTFDVKIHYMSDEGRKAAIREANCYFKKVSSSEGERTRNKSPD